MASPPTTSSTSPISPKSSTSPNSSTSPTSSTSSTSYPDISTDSPPATPPPELPEDSESSRFKYSNAPCEWAEKYRPTGYHPVSLGDTFHGGKYRVIRKLGYGSHATVWLAVSTGTPRYVALKIMAAKAPPTTTELRMLDTLSKLAPRDTRAQHVTRLLDTFEHQGINGKHQCLVFELMAVSAAVLFEVLPENQPKMYNKRQRYPTWMAKKMLLHALRGLAFLHQNGIVHADFQPGNILFSTKDLSDVEEDNLKQDETSTSRAVHRIDGKPDKWAPKNLYIDQSLHDRVELGPEFCVKVSDLGSAFYLSDPPKEPATPIGLRAPELIFHQAFDQSIDIWSFGCLIFEFLTGMALFSVGIYGYDEEGLEDSDDDHLLQLYDILCPLPDSFISAWPRASIWMTPDRQRLRPYDDCEPFIHPSLEEQFKKYKPDNIDDEESAVVCALLRQILDYDPAKRPSAEDLLKHPWFSESTVSSV